MQPSRERDEKKFEHLSKFGRKAREYHELIHAQIGRLVFAKRSYKKAPSAFYRGERTKDKEFNEFASETTKANNVF